MGERRNRVCTGGLVAFAALASCGHGSATTPHRPCDATTAAHGEETEVVESWPVETDLDHPEIRDADEVWRTMIDGARRSIDLAHFYASEAEPPLLATSKLSKVVDALGSASKRGVRVRFLADASFAERYERTLTDLARRGIEVRRFDVAKTMGGVLHAKYFVVDRSEAFVGSQNFDWRSLGHIQEIGLRHVGPVAAQLESVFEMDWALAAGERPPPGATRVTTCGSAGLVLAASPARFLPEGVPWDLPELVAMIDGARGSVFVQLLTYGTHNRDGSRFTTLDDALRAAARRGVKVHLVVSHWAVKPKSRSLEALEALAKEPGVEIKILPIPPWSGGEIPFARVAHAKFAVVDMMQRAWVGTSNWEGDYFLRSRNVSLFTRPGEHAVAHQLMRFFLQTWQGARVHPLADFTSGDARGTSGAPPSDSGPARR